MKCPFCNNNETQVKDTRNTGDSSSVRRKRLCLKCGAKFTTFETVYKQIYQVVKRNGEKEDINPKKITDSMLIALRNRDISIDDIELFTDAIMKEIEKNSSQIIPVEEIGSLVLKQLKNIDEVAFIRYASVYKKFQTVEDFRNLVSEFDNEKIID